MPELRGDGAGVARQPRAPAVQGLRPPEHRYRWHDFRQDALVQASVMPGAKVRTDGSAAYRSLSSLGYEHERIVMLGSEVVAHVSMPGVHRVASLVKRWILGTHHGSVQPGHLDAYLDEFVFRFNRRSSASRGMLFYRLLQQAVVTEPVTYDSVVKPLRESAKQA